MAQAKDTTRVKLAHGASPVNEGGVVNIGVRSVTLPGVKEQKEGFDLPTKDAKLMLSQFPDRYKRMETTGTPQQGQNQQQGDQQGEGQLSSDDTRDADVTGDAESADIEGHEEDADPKLRDGQVLAELTTHEGEEGHDDAEKD